jgi:hypothetical protein
MTPSESRFVSSTGDLPYRLARVLVADVYARTESVRQRAEAGRELRRAAVVTASRLLRTPLQDGAREDHRRSALEGLDHLDRWIETCRNEGTLSREEAEQLSDLRARLVAALTDA